MNIYKKLWTGGTDLRKSRFHDEKGHLIDALGLINAPRAIVSLAARIILGYRPVAPWLGYRAIRRIKKIINTESKVLEFGSGLSTIWFSRNAQFVFSVESNRNWYEAIKLRLENEKKKNVQYEFRDIKNYSDVDNFQDGYFDFVLIDGENRSKCMETAIKKVKSGGYIYLDNSDKFAVDPNGDVRQSENKLLEALKIIGNKPEYYVDFCPGFFAVTEGVLGRM